MIDARGQMRLGEGAGLAVFGWVGGLGVCSLVLFPPSSSITNNSHGGLVPGDKYPLEPTS